MEREENPNQLLKNALIKKGVIQKDEIISQEELDKIFEFLKNEIKNKEGK